MWLLQPNAFRQIPRENLTALSLNVQAFSKIPCRFQWRDRDRQTDRQTETERQAETERQTDRDTHTERQ